MSIRFKGGESLQRGRGIGGLLRLAKSVFSPIIKTLGKTAIKAVKSKTGKAVLGAIKDQALTSGMNMAADAIRGNDLTESFQNEVAAVRQTVGDSVQNFVTPRKKTRNGITGKKSKQKTVLRQNVNLKTQTQVGNNYSDKNKTDFFT